MPEKRTSEVLAGVFFILATVMGVTMAILLAPILQGENPLQAVAENAGTMRLSVLLNIIMAGAVIAIAVVLYPILQRYSKTLAIGYLTARLGEGIFLALAGMAWLGLSPNTPALSELLMAQSTAMFTLGAEITFGITALILNTLLIKAQLVPRWLSYWGLLAGGLILALGVLKTAGLPYAALEAAFTAPIALNEMVLAVWLIVKGFSAGRQT